MRVKACLRCRTKKLKCEPSTPCGPCTQANAECRPQRVDLRQNQGRLPKIAPLHSDHIRVMLEEMSAIDLGRNLLGHDNPSDDLEVSNAIPGGSGDASTNFNFSWQEMFPYEIPAPSILDVLISNYFASVNWFMLVVDEKSFREEFATFQRLERVAGNNFNFCILLATIWGLGAHYLRKSPDAQVDKETLDSICLDTFQHLQYVFLQVVSNPSIETVQIGILFGSYNLFNGSPNLGFGILGSTVKIAQVLGLHRGHSVKNAHGRNSTASRMIWWALEIFDKYAAIAFGRPSTIDDSDCDVEEIDDDDDYDDNFASQTNVNSLTYHKHKARLYRIMGAFLGRKRQSNQLVTLEETRTRLIQTYAVVPDMLKYGTDIDEMNNRPLLTQMQAIALVLAYDNLQFVLHRQAILAPKPQQMSPAQRRDALNQLLESALRTSNVLQYSAVGSIYGTTHAAMHLGVCALTAGIVLSGILLNNQSLERRKEAFAGVQRIIGLFQHFSGHSYKFADQSLRILKVLEAKIMVKTREFQKVTSQNVSTAQQRTVDHVDRVNNSTDWPGWEQGFDDSIFSSSAIDSQASNDFSIGTERTMYDDIDLMIGTPVDSIGQAWLWADNWYEDAAQFQF